MSNAMLCKNIDLSPAKWIWLPCERTLTNTFVFFRYEFVLETDVKSSSCYVLADSRYVLYVNGEAVSKGPAPFDPRRPEADKVDISAFLKKGKNVIAAHVLWFGMGEGTYVPSNPGFILNADIALSDEKSFNVCTSKNWKCCIDRSHTPGMHQQSFMRALQEVFDARVYQESWNAVGFDDSGWLAAAECDTPSNKPTICDSKSSLDYSCICADESAIDVRSIPFMREIPFGDMDIIGKGDVLWNRPYSDWFDYRIDGSFSIENYISSELGKEATIPALKENEGVIITFGGLSEQISGWVEIEVDAPSGTVIEIMEQESFEPESPWFDTHYYNWQRIICKEGRNLFRTFEYFCFKYVQLHIHGNSSDVKINRVSAVRRLYNFNCDISFSCSDEKLNKVFNANANTIKNCVQDVMTDGIGRERQQYSGDCGHTLMPLYYGYNEKKLPTRFFNTFVLGQALEGYFLDCWPANDRLKRIPQRQIGATPWGPILDHGVQFVFDCQNHLLLTGDKKTYDHIVPNVIKFCDFIIGLKADDGLIPVGDKELGVYSVWLDHYAYAKQEHKKCSFNLYVAAMLKYAAATICKNVGLVDKCKDYEDEAELILSSAVKRFWCPKRRVFIDNLPTETSEGETRISERSVALSLIFDFCPEGEISESIDVLKREVKEEQLQNTLYNSLSHKWGDNINISYPANAVWKYMALVKHKQLDTVLNEIKTVWYNMRSVHENNTLSEDWRPKAGKKELWSHCAMSPLIVLYTGICGVIPADDGGRKVVFQPQTGDFGVIEADVWVGDKKIVFRSFEKDGKRGVTYIIPDGVTAYLNTGDELVNSYTVLKDGIPDSAVMVDGKEITVELR